MRASGDMSSSRVRREREFHEAQSARRAGEISGEALRFEDRTWLDHEDWVRDTFDVLGDVRDKWVLDYGAGEGWSSVILARRGAKVAAFDIAHGNALMASRRAAANGVGDRVALQEMAGERLGYRSGVFQAVYGNAVLHHVDLEAAGRELLRVLRPGGVAVFSEPWGGNPVLEFVRRHVPYRGKDRTPDERPLRVEDVEKLRALFPTLEIRPYQLLSMIRRQFPWRPLIRALEAADGRLLKLFPSLWRYCRYVVLVLRTERT
ncbi:MAG: class I SAM-dependent methyltransferase [bacterium]|nr:class I SAM-dependent methyltransferase [bacterium]